MLKQAICALALVAVLSSVDACGNQATPTTAPVTNPSDVASDPDGLTGTISLGIWPEDTQTEAIASHEGYVTAMKALHPNMELKPQYYSYAVDTFVSLAESGNLPTIFTTWFTEPTKLINGEFVADITDELRQRGWLDLMTPAIKDLLTREDKTYGVPSNAYALGLMINVELFEEAGLVDADGLPIYPKTFQELAETAKKIKDATGASGLCLLAMDNAGGWHFSNIAWNFGAELVTQGADGKWTAELDTPEAIEAMEFIKSLKWEYDVLTADPTVENWSTGFQQLGTGGAAMYIAANDAVAQPTFNNGLPVDKLALVPMPSGPRGDQFMLMGGNQFMYSKAATSDEVLASFDYLELMGHGPILSETSLQGMRDGAALNVEQGIPNIAPFPVWDAPEVNAAREAVAKEYENTNPALYADYFETVQMEGKLRAESEAAQDMYAELTKVLQAVITDQNADVAALMATADANYQSILDATSNN
jgi:ABC-type glycerol-3-phosphate transport system substrate-binding protein